MSTAHRMPLLSPKLKLQKAYYSFQRRKDKLQVVPKNSPLLVLRQRIGWLERERQ